MADFIAKLGLDAKDFVAGLETAAQKAGVVTQALQKSSDDSKGLASGLNDAGKAADGLVESTRKIEDNLAKAGSGGGALDGLTSKFKEGQAAASSGGGMFGEVANKLGQLATPAGAATAAIGALTAGIAASVSIGSEFQQNLAGVSAITGVTGAGLDDIGNRARELAKRFGGEASTQLQSFQGILSKFGAQLADTPDKLGTVSENINILAKAGGIDAAGAMDSLTASMLQFGVDTSDANALASESGRFINVLAASAKVGAAEIPQVAEAVKVAGVAAKGAKVSFEETNAAVQVLAAGGKVGAEAGTALRNVLGKIAGEEVIPKPALDKLKSLGVDMSIVSNTSLSFSDRLKELSKASGDATAFAQVFGSENAAAANILANGAQTVQDWTKEITGTDEATKQAATNMNTFSGQMDRAKSAIQDIAIGAFQALAPPVTAAVGFILDFAGVVSGAIGGLWSFLRPLVQPIIDFFEFQLLAPINVAKAIVSGFVEAAQAAFARFLVVIKPLQDALAGLFEGASEGTSIMDSLKVVFEVIANVAEAVFSVALGIAVKYVELLVGVVVRLVDFIKQGITFIKDIARAVTDWGTNLIKTNETIGFVVQKIQDFVAGVIKLKDEILSFLGLANEGADVKITAKVETKPEETNKKIEDDANKNPPKIGAKVTGKATDDADKKAADASKKLLDEKKNLFETEKSILENQSQQTVKAIQQKAIAENRKLTQSEQADILREEIALIDRIAEKRREVFNISGQGKDLKTALKLTAKDAQDIQDSVRDAQTKAGEAEVKLRFSIINIGEAQVKEQVAWVARTAKSTEEDLKKELTVEFFTGINEAEATIKIADAVQKLKDKAAQAAALGDNEAAAKILAQARELEEKLTENAKKGNEKRLKDAEENRKKDLQLKLEAIDNEKARTLAKQIIELAEKKREVLASDRGTNEERAKIAARYQREIDELAKGTDKSITDQRAKLAKEEAELVKSLKARKISYEEYNKQIAEIQSQSSEIDKQVDANKKAAKEVSDAVSDIVKPAVKPIEISVEGAAVAFTNALDFYNSLVSSGEKAKDALDKTFENLKDSINANFDEIAAKAAKALQFDNVFDLQTLTSNTTEAATIISAAFAKAKNNGKRDSDAYKESLQATNQAIAASLGSSIDKQTAKFNELRDKGEATYSQVAEIAVLSLGKAAVEGKNLAKESLKIIVESALKMIEINLVTLLTAFGATGPAGLLAGIGAVALLRGLAAAAFANVGYQDGGYTGNKGTSDVAGVVHGQEFVHTAGVTRRYRPLFEHLHKGGELSTWAIGVTGQLQTQNQPQPFVSTYGIETRLERLETAIVRGNRKFESMRAVQMTVEHDPSLIIKSQARNLEVRSARA